MLAINVKRSPIPGAEPLLVMFGFVDIEKEEEAGSEEAD